VGQGDPRGSAHITGPNGRSIGSCFASAFGGILLGSEKRSLWGQLLTFPLRSISGPHTSPMRSTWTGRSSDGRRENWITHPGSTRSRRGFGSTRTNGESGHCRHCGSRSLRHGIVFLMSRCLTATNPPNRSSRIRRLLFLRFCPRRTACSVSSETRRLPGNGYPRNLGHRSPGQHLLSI
jgi:hypothetical protein